MRIIGHIPNPIMKITVFQMETRYSVKFEIGMMEQVYRIRQSEVIHNFKDVEKRIDSIFVEHVIEQFKSMSSGMKESFMRHQPE